MAAAPRETLPPEQRPVSRTYTVPWADRAARRVVSPLGGRSPAEKAACGGCAARVALCLRSCRADVADDVGQVEVADDVSSTGAARTKLRCRDSP